MWFLLALGAALCMACKDAAIKRAGHIENLDSLTLCWAYCWLTPLFLLPALLYAGAPALQSAFWPAVGVNSLLHAVSFSLYFRALKASDLSITAPMLAFTPLFMLASSPIILGEFPAPLGFLGIGLIVTGSYMLHGKERKGGFWRPFQALFKEPGPRMMFAVAVIWSICGNVDKMAVQASSPLFYLVVDFSLVGVWLTLVVGRRLPGQWRALSSYRAAGVQGAALVGGFEALGLFLQMTALTMTLAPYVIAVKRLSLVFSVLLGALLFREQRLRDRLAGGGVMLAGVFCIAFS